MSNFSLDDRHRSIRRFVMNAVGSPPWTVRTEVQPVADEERPVAVVEPIGVAATTRSRTSIPQGEVERAQSFAVTLYPVLAETAAESRLEAAGVADLLDQAITVGLVTDVVPGVDPEPDTGGELLSPPQMIPVYDFAGVAVKGAARAGPAEYYGWLRVEDYGVQPLQDPEDPLRFTVVCTVRCSWEQAGRSRRDVVEGPLVGSMPMSPVWTGDAEL